MPQMAPYNWFLLNILFSLMFMMYMIILNFFPIKKFSLKKNKSSTIFFIKW